MIEQSKQAQFIEQNIKRIIEKINDLKLKEGLNKEIIIIAASKTFPLEDILICNKLGISNFGENYIQEAIDKFPKINGIKKHFIGHLQSNKVKKAVEIFDIIQTIDSFELAAKINKEAIKLNKKINILIEINFAKEETKSGIYPSEVFELIKQIRELKSLNLIGLMSMAQKEYFKEIKELFDKTNLEYLSMGMSDDYLEAIKNGSNMIRLGRAIFGERLKK
jgi:PLP dependent protein